MSTMSSVTSNGWPDLYAVCPAPAPPQNGLSMVVQPSSFLSASHPISVSASQSVSMLSSAIASAVPAPDLTYWMPHSCFHTMPTAASSGGTLMANYNFVPVYSQLTAEPLASAYGPHIATTGQIQLFNPLMNSTK